MLYPAELRARVSISGISASLDAMAGQPESGTERKPAAQAGTMASQFGAHAQGIPTRSAETACPARSMMGSPVGLPMRPNTMITAHEIERREL